jgi:arsenite methyltransferase
LREAFRVLKPGGRIAGSDIVTRGEISEDIRRNALLWAGCVAGALDEKDYLAKLEAAGFEQISIEATRVYGLDDAANHLKARAWTWMQSLRRSKASSSVALYVP